MTDSLMTIANKLTVSFRRGYGSPPTYDSNWEHIFGCEVSQIQINKGAESSVAVVWFPQLRWNETFNLYHGDQILIQTSDPIASQRITLFSGFVTSYLSSFHGGDQRPGSGHERTAYVCHDYRWLLSSCNFIFGCHTRGPSDYNNYGTASQSAISDTYVWLTGLRTIFNKDGRPNCDPTLLQYSDSGGYLCDIPIFSDRDDAVYFTARKMIQNVLSPLWNRVYNYYPIVPSDFYELGVDGDGSDWDTVINNVIVDGLNPLQAAGHIANLIGWDFQECYSPQGGVGLFFYKAGSAGSYTRDDYNFTILHDLYAPSPKENITEAVQTGEKMLWSMNLAEDIASVVNTPWAIGAPRIYEITAELVPAWRDGDFTIDEEDLEELFFSESELEAMTDKESHDYFKYYHARGSQFKRSVLRKWALNESGKYSIAPKFSFDKYYKKGDVVSNGGTHWQAKYDLGPSVYGPPSGNWQEVDAYDRGAPFDFSTVIPGLVDSGVKFYSPRNRRFLGCLTTLDDTDSSIGLKVEFSFDGGTTWQIIPGTISNVDYECAIYIDAPNLAELVDINEAEIASGDLAGKQLNYFTSLADDKINSRVFKDDEWKTRVRVTASVQMDLRLSARLNQSNLSGSPFNQSTVYDFSNKYRYLSRTSSSILSDDLGSFRRDDSDLLKDHLKGVQRANEGFDISGRFTLAKMYTYGNDIFPVFLPGDIVQNISGRNYSLSTSQIAGAAKGPEIVKIIYQPAQHKVTLLTRDLRYSMEAPI